MKKLADAITKFEEGKCEDARDKLTDFHKLLTVIRTESDSDLDGREEDRASSRTYDPGATMKDRDKRQSLADEVEAGFDDPVGV